MWAQFAELGLLNGVPVSDEDGGLGAGPIDAMVRMKSSGKGLVVLSLPCQAWSVRLCAFLEAR